MSSDDSQQSWIYGRCETQCGHGGEAPHSNIIDDYLRCFCSFRLQRIVTFT